MSPSTLAASLAALMLLGPNVVRADDAAAPKPATAAKTAKHAKPAKHATHATPATKPAAAKPAAAAEAEHITIQHVLIGFQGTLPGKTITRTKDDAQKLAGEILARAKKGEDFPALVKQYTDDAFPGIYSMSNNGVAPAPGERPRSGMVPAFGDAGFPLKVGEVGMASYDQTRSPYGWHIVKRIK